jgi:hypothetical protein
MKKLSLAVKKLRTISRLPATLLAYESSYQNTATLTAAADGHYAKMVKTGILCCS